MACRKFKSNGCEGMICLPNFYEYKGYVFEWHNYLGPTPLRKDYEPRKNIPKGFWDAVAEFSELSEKDRKEYLIYG